MKSRKADRRRNGIFRVFPYKLGLPIKPNEEGIYDVETELLDIAELHADFYIKRYKRQKSGHWKEREKRNNFVGLICQKIFHIILQQLSVPCDINDPAIDWRKKKDYDFAIPKLGTVEVKGWDSRESIRKVLIKTSEWHSSDYCVVFKLIDSRPTKVSLCGWLTRSQVEKLPISKKGETKYTPNADAYITTFDKLNSPSKFITLLEKAKST